MAYPKGDKRTGAIASRPHPGVKIPSETIAQLLVKHSGNVSKAAQAIGCSRHTLIGRINNEPDLKQILDDARERWIDEVEESVFMRAVDSNDTALQKFVLSTQARNRGWDNMESQNTAKDIASAAFAFILDKSKNPAEHKS